MTDGSDRMRKLEPVPVSYMQGGVDRYITQGLRPGRFLMALFSNDLKGAFQAADETNTAAMHEWVKFLFCNVPMMAQGSPEKVEEWIAMHESERVAREAGNLDEFGGMRIPADGDQ